MARGLVVLGLVLAGFLALAWLAQRSLVYFPSQVVPAEPPPGVEAVDLRTADGLVLVAWLVEPGGNHAARSTVLVFHGNAGNRVGRVPLARRLAAAGHEVLLVDYRGYGGNPGSPSAAGLALDARAAWDFAAERDGGRPVVLLGESLGAGVALELAQDHEPDAIVLRSPFSSLVDIAQHHYPLVPGWFLRDRWPNLERIADLEVPVLLVAGGGDRIVPVSQTRRLHEAAGGPSRLVVVDGADHNDPVLLAGDAVVSAIVAFLDDHLPPG